ncbi:MAG: cobalt-precorrin-5B (C(1))-methyltransferase CbiD [Candidatus Bathyarchaeota archaeon]|nr:cobalt-precorrin-5B (C(1))-methyltransferase CbiD [Candidatus Bathyarchaeota archaeon]
MPRFLKYGITTGACAAAAAKAAVTALVNNPVDRVVIPTPIGIRFEIPVKESKRLSDDAAVAVVVKDAGDDIDATDKIEISATVKLTGDSEVTIKSGKGIGIVTKPGLAVAVGEPAINPVPRKMIIEAAKEALPTGRGAEVVIEIPEGEKVAKKTLNAKLGVVGGVSVLGTTGVVKPLSMEACRRSLVPQIDVALAKGYERIFMVPGNIGERITKKLFKAPDDAIVQTGDFMGYMLDKTVEKGVKEIVLVGHPGKLTKLAAGIFNTHHKMGDARAEVIAAYAGAAGADSQLIKRILKSNTTEEAASLLQQANLSQATFNGIAERVRTRVMERIKEKAKVSVIIVSLDGAILGMDKTQGVQNSG